jgi:hypothetical protein
MKRERGGDEARISFVVCVRNKSETKAKAKSEIRDMMVGQMKG